MASFTGRSFTWRGDPYRFGPGGRVISLRPERLARASESPAPSIQASPGND